METLVAILVLVGLAVLGGVYGTDSRPDDVQKASRWWPATPRGEPATPWALASSVPGPQKPTGSRTRITVVRPGV
jgi:hypothetical protein